MSHTFGFLKPVMSVALTVSMAFAFTGCGSASSDDAVTLDAPVSGGAGTATSILNAGVMTHMGEQAGDPIKLLFDPLYDDHFGSLEQLTPELIEAIIAGTAPYDGVDAVFVSHAHGDHFSASMLTRMLTEQEQLTVVAPAQAIVRLRDEAAWQDSFEARVIGIELENGEAAKSIQLSGLEIEAFRSPHSGWPDRHAEVHNLTFRVSALSPAPEGSGEAAYWRVMHLGDADPASEHFVALESFLQAKRTGLAMVPFWFYRRDELRAFIDQTLNAENVVAVHVPVEVPGYLQEGDLPYFSGVGEMLEIPVTP